MARFKKSQKRQNTSISTASLPDIIFILLFFFMVVTVMRRTDHDLKIIKPIGSETIDIPKELDAGHIYIGSIKSSKSGSTRIMLDDASAEITDVKEWAQRVISEMDEDLKSASIITLNIDSDTEMGLVTDVKQELREANALKINYSVNRGALATKKK